MSAVRRRRICISSDFVHSQPAAGYLLGATVSELPGLGEVIEVGANERVQVLAGGYHDILVLVDAYVVDWRGVADVELGPVDLGAAEAANIPPLTSGGMLRM